MNSIQSRGERAPAELGLIGIDWGTTNLRATLINLDGTPANTRSSPEGIGRISGEQFSSSLMQLCGDWISEYQIPILASGMIGSRQGWCEAPYLNAPASISQAARSLARISFNTDAPPLKREIHIIPGVKSEAHNGLVDVMRGEETQIWGAWSGVTDLMLLPGTHSKWAIVNGVGQITSLQTFMTGELFSLLVEHSILGRLMTLGVECAESFEAGVKLGLKQSDRVTNTLFSVRTAGLTGSVSANGLRDYLSGILIGTEVGAALRGSAAIGSWDRRVRVIGTPELGSRYMRALRLAGRSVEVVETDVATRGHWLIAKDADLLASSV